MDVQGAIDMMNLLFQDDIVPWGKVAKVSVKSYTGHGTNLMEEIAFLKRKTVDGGYFIIENFARRVSNVGIIYWYKGTVNTSLQVGITEYNKKVILIFYVKKQE